MRTACNTAPTESVVQKRLPLGALSRMRYTSNSIGEQNAANRRAAACESQATESHCYEAFASDLFAGRFSTRFLNLKLRFWNWESKIQNL